MVNLFARYVDRFGGGEKVAERLGITPSMVSLLKNGERRPSLALALTIERVTRGGVPAKSWKKEPNRDGRKGTNPRRRA